MGCDVACRDSMQGREYQLLCQDCRQCYVIIVQDVDLASCFVSIFFTSCVITKPRDTQNGKQIRIKRHLNQRPTACLHEPITAVPVQLDHHLSFRASDVNQDQIICKECCRVVSAPQGNITELFKCLNTPHRWQYN